MNNIIFRCIHDINMEDDIRYDIENIDNINIVNENINEVIPLNTADISYNAGCDIGEVVGTTRDIVDMESISTRTGRCICRYNNFNLCNRHIVNNLLYCRYHKNTKIGYIHKIFYDVFNDKKEINVCDLYMLYRHINNFGYIKELYIDLLKNIPFKILLNIAEKNYIISNDRKYSKNEIYSQLYNINKNTHELESNHLNMKGFCKIQYRIKDILINRIKNRIRDKLRDNIFKLEDYESAISRGDYMNSEELFTGENICDIPPNRLYVLCNKSNNSDCNIKSEKSEKSEKYIFEAVELEYFVRKCRENKQEPYNPYNRDKLDEDFLENLYMFIKYNGLIIKNEEYLWENNMHAFTELSLEIESRGFYNSPEWFQRLKDSDFLKVIKYFKLFSANTPESNKYFNEIRADTLIFDFCKDAIKMFKECNDEYYILCCNFIKAMALCSNNFYNNLPTWLLANGTGGVNGASGAGGHIGIGSIIDNIRINTNLETLTGAINRNNASELANNFLLYYYVEYS
jgi:hypothetical protein